MAGLISPLNGVSKVSGGGGGLTSAQATTIATNLDAAQDASNAATFASQASLNSLMNGTLSATTLDCGTLTASNVSCLGSVTAGGVDLGSNVSSLTGAVAGINSTVSNVLSGTQELDSLKVANLTYTSGADNSVDTLMTAKADSLNEGGFRIRNTVHNVGGNTLSFSSFDNSTSTTLSAPSEVMSLFLNPDSGSQRLTTTDIHCDRVFATSLLSVGGVSLRAAGSHLQTQSWVGSSGSYGQTHPTFTGSASTDVTSTSYVDILSATFTPSSSSSVLNVKVGNMGCHLVSTAGNAFPNGSLWELRFEIGGVACGRRYSHYAGAGYLMNNSTEEFGSLSNLFGRYINSGTSALTIKIQGLSTTGSTTEYLKVYTDNAILECTEIQA